MTPGRPPCPRLHPCGRPGAPTRQLRALWEQAAALSLNRAAPPALDISAPNTTCPCPPSMPGNAACPPPTLPTPPAAADCAHQATASFHKLLPNLTSHRTRPTHRHRHPACRTAAIWTSFAPWSRLWEVPRAEPLSPAVKLWYLSDSRRHGSGVRWFACLLVSNLVSKGDPFSGHLFIFSETSNADRLKVPPLLGRTRTLALWCQRLECRALPLSPKPPPGQTSPGVDRRTSSR